MALTDDTVREPSDDEVFAPAPSPLDVPIAEQSEISEEISRRHAAARPGLVQPAVDFRPYRSSELRHPTKDLRHADPEGVELFSPVFGHRDVDPIESDLTLHPAGEPVGERIRITGRVLDGDGRPVAGQLVEIWQANAAGRYVHKRDAHPAPLDPHFTGVGRTITGADGSYDFVTIKPGPYPWKNHRNAWRPAHVHFSLFGSEFTQRMVTQMYFPGDPLLPLDPIYQAITDQRARDRLVSVYDHDVSEHEWLLGYRWDIVLTGTHSTPMEPEEGEH
ncbi:protocatechuate 3,4-dioxygenase subunit beta [Ornithinimicrobium tianjinense]|uniref:Protocatechuate 3,4-dioxygenase subunit beta n=1 Tax=Ornithinimicrobium tianjinense TaxID=1195761 RepID=A0A917BG31_9MICO|nr:protocatechuate 3,4-dioxygenase subunit beta [Ornithinimicrobium tianjinense]GGF40710.1 protocatechuate 3,4-dioxygenase subunit beta [Ornithinimicrobium tianjinense]